MVATDKWHLAFFRSALPLLGGCLAVLLLFPQALRSLHSPDPAKSQALQFDFAGPAAKLPQQVQWQGFSRTANGLSLDPGAKGLCTWQVAKQKGQGCLLRVWLYGTAEQPCSLSVSVDNGATYSALLQQGSHNGDVLDITPRVQDATVLAFRLTAENHAPYSAVISDRLSLYIGAGSAVAPALPDMVLPCAAFLLAYFAVFVMAHRHAGLRALLCRCALCGIVFVAFALRWHELARIAGTALDPDAQGFLHFARIMDLFGSYGFYSARFDIREPLYLLVAKIFLNVLGPSETHLRLVSCLFSMLAIVLAWQVGRTWLAEPVGLLAAGLLAIHPYLVQLSARGLREEFFTCLLLLALIISGWQPKKFLRLRTVGMGLLIGALALTRSETIPMIVLILACLILFARRGWSTSKALVAFGIGIALYAPHLYGAYQQQGNPFYTMNIQARFYANMEFSGKPGFPTPQELAENGLCSGPAITPFEYYFKLHSLPELAATSARGLSKIMLSMPLSFAQGKGMLRQVAFSFNCLREQRAWAACSDRFKWAAEIPARDMADYCCTALLLLALAGGIICLLAHREFFICSCLVTFVAHLSFLAGIGIDQRLAAHAYPISALCCAYGLFCLGRKARAARVPATTTSPQRFA